MDLKLYDNMLRLNTAIIVKEKFYVILRKMLILQQLIKERIRFFSRSINKYNEFPEAETGQTMASYNSLHNIVSR